MTINYRPRTKEDYINDDDSYYQHYYDSELDRLYLAGESYYDLTDYKYYDTAGGHYDPAENKYYNADGSYYDLVEKLFYDVDGNATELVDNRAEYEPYYEPPEDIDGDGLPDDDYSDPYNQSRHYLPTGGYISLYNDTFYDALGGYIGESNSDYYEGKSYFFYEDYEGVSDYGVRIDEIRGYYGLLLLIFPDFLELQLPK